MIRPRFIFLLLGLLSLTINVNAQSVLHKANWIAPAYQEVAVKLPCPVFQKEFKLNDHKPLKSATLYITALGLYEARLNGKRIGDAYFTPGFTNYNKRLQYQRYDVKDLLQTSNSLNVTVGEGWYRGTFRGAKSNNNYGAEAGLLAQLELTYTDGSKDTIATDPSWKCTTGPIRYSELYDGTGLCHYRQFFKRYQKLL